MCKARFLAFFLRWSKSTVWKRMVTGAFCLPNVISITSLLPNSTQFWKIHKLSLHLEGKKITQTCIPKNTIRRGTENAQKLEQRLKKQIKTEMEIKEPDNLGNQGCCSETKHSVYLSFDFCSVFCCKPMNHYLL